MITGIVFLLFLCLSLFACVLTMVPKAGRTFMAKLGLGAMLALTTLLLIASVHFDLGFQNQALTIRLLSHGYVIMRYSEVPKDAATRDDDV